MKPVFDKDGIPRCGSLACNSSRFEGTFIMVGVNRWKLENLYCQDCGMDIELTPEFIIYIEKEDWKMRGQNPRAISISG
jgi:hypothetical protein